MAMGACPGQKPMPCVPPALMVTATMVRACRYSTIRKPLVHWSCSIDFLFELVWSKKLRKKTTKTLIEVY